MVTRSHLKTLRALRRSAARDRTGRYLIEGGRLVGEALRSGAPVAEILVTACFEEGPAGAGILARARECGVEPERISAREAQLLADTRSPQGVFAVLSHAEGEPWRPPRDGIVLFLDGVSDPGNVGTLVRAADAFAARAVVASLTCASFRNPKVLRASMGSTFHVPCRRVESLAGSLRSVRAAGGRILAATLDGSDARGPDSAALVGLVLGSEAHGVSEEVRELADREVTVRCPGAAESLNVAMAGAILLSELCGSGRKEA